MKLSAYREPEDSIELDLVEVKLWFSPEDMEIEYYELPAEPVRQLDEFAETGRVPSALRQELQKVLNEFPAWSELSIDDNLTREQRESVAGAYVVTRGRRVSIQYGLSVGVTVY